MDRLYGPEAWVVICDQPYANYTRLVGVFSTEEYAEEIASLSVDYRVEKFTVDSVNKGG